MKKFCKDESARLSLKALGSERKRAHHLLHESHSDKVQRLVIALIKNSYIQPHYHELDNQWESFVVLSGSVKLITFTEDGVVLTSEDIEQGCIVEIEPMTIHTLVSNSDESLIYEIKEGPFVENYSKCNMNWAPKENSRYVDLFLRKLYLSEIGQSIGLTEFEKTINC